MADDCNFVMLSEPPAPEPGIVLSETNMSEAAGLEDCKELMSHHFPEGWDIDLSDIKVKVVQGSTGISASFLGPIAEGDWLLIRGAAATSVDNALARLREELIKFWRKPTPRQRAPYQRHWPGQSGAGLGSGSGASRTHNATVQVAPQVPTDTLQSAVDPAPAVNPWESGLPPGLSTVDIVLQHKGCLGGGALLELLEERRLSYGKIISILSDNSVTPMTVEQRKAIRDRLAWRAKKARDGRETAATAAPATAEPAGAKLATTNPVTAGAAIAEAATAEAATDQPVTTEQLLLLHCKLQPFRQR